MSNNSHQKILISVVGPTASGKTSLGIEIAKYFNTEIVSADSRQFYRELNIGTAKPTAAELGVVRHHFIDSHSIHDNYSVGAYERDAIKLLDELFDKHQVVVLVGGSGLFCKAVWEGIDEMPKVDESLRYSINAEVAENGLTRLLQELKNADPEYNKSVDRKNTQRITRAIEVIRTTGKPYSELRKRKPSKRSFENIKLGLDIPREVLYQRINDRMDAMIVDGLFDEATELYPIRSKNALQTVGYSEVFGMMDGKFDQEEAVRLLKRNSRRYAKRQLTWFGKDEEIRWINPKDINSILLEVENTLNT